MNSRSFEDFTPEQMFLLRKKLMSQIEEADTMIRSNKYELEALNGENKKRVQNKNRLTRDGFPLKRKFECFCSCHLEQLIDFDAESGFCPRCEGYVVLPTETK
jgi:hypothetical protein